MSLPTGGGTLAVQPEFQLCPELQGAFLPDSGPRIPAAGPHRWPPLPQALQPSPAGLFSANTPGLPPSLPPNSSPPPGRWASVCRMVRSREVILSRPSAGPSCLQPGTGLPFPFLICSGIKRGACFKVSRPPRPLGLPERGPGNVLGSGGHPGDGM